MSFEHKYLKYKSKYLGLKYLIYGGTIHRNNKKTIIKPNKLLIKQQIEDDDSYIKSKQPIKLEKLLTYFKKRRIKPSHIGKIDVDKIGLDEIGVDEIEIDETDYDHNLIENLQIFLLKRKNQIKMRTERIKKNKELLQKIEQKELETQLEDEYQAQLEKQLGYKLLRVPLKLQLPSSIPEHDNLMSELPPHSFNVKRRFKYVPLQRIPPTAPPTTLPVGYARRRRGAIGSMPIVSEDSTNES